MAGIGEYYEQISPSAFERSLRQKADVRALFNHSPDQILGRVSAGTLQLASEKDGLHFEISLPNTSIGKDVHTLVSRGDIRECSFAFECRKDKWTMITANGKAAQLRTLEDVALFDVSVVTFPAYAQGTSVSARGGVYGRQRSRPKSLGNTNFAPEASSSDRERERLKLMVRLAMHI
jgi:HK97 family phage prohead protease